MMLAKDFMVKLGSPKKNSHLTSILLQKRKNNLKNNKQRKNKNLNKRSKKNQRKKRKNNNNKMFTHLLLPRKRRKIHLMNSQSQLSTSMTSKEILLMLKINPKLFKDSGLLTTQQDGAFGNQIMNCMKDKVKLDI